MHLTVVMQVPPPAYFYEFSYSDTPALKQGWWAETSKSKSPEPSVSQQRNIVSHAGHEWEILGGKSYKQVNKQIVIQ